MKFDPNKSKAFLNCQFDNVGHIFREEKIYRHQDFPERICFGSIHLYSDCFFFARTIKQVINIRLLAQTTCIIKIFKIHSEVISILFMITIIIEYFVWCNKNFHQSENLILIKNSKTLNLYRGSVVFSVMDIKRVKMLCRFYHRLILKVVQKIARISRKN